ncbi:MFS transporter [Nocardioides sp. Bht2]|uniref:MFS transporter n=1 Tax=Nocardioides sp. Bht2 TaxID=3392297 RepID=UPI0039B57AB8
MADRPTRFLIPAMVVLTLITGVVSSLGAPLVPAIAEHEGVRLVSAQWALTGTLLTAAVSAPILGRIGAGRRRKPTIIVVLIVVVIGCLLAALPLGFGGLVAGRVLQGLGFGVSPLAIAVVRDALDDERGRLAAATLSVANVVSVGVGFPVAAGVAHLVGVKGAFGLAGALALVALVVAVWTVPGSAAVVASGVDWVGAVLLGAATVAILLALSRSGTWGYTDPRTVTLSGLGLLLGALCTWWLLRVHAPLVDLRLALRHGVIGANAAGLLAGIGMYLMMAMVVVLVQGGNDGGFGLRHSLPMAGLMMTPYAAASVVGNRLALWLGPRIGPDLVLPVGCLLFACANLILAGWHDHLWQVALVMAIGGLGSGATFNAIPWLMLRVVPHHETSSALGFNMVMRFAGFATGSALSVAVLAQHTDVTGHPVESGFVAGSLTGVVISVAAALCCLFLARAAGRAAEVG